jgi:hypothetical protein
MRTRLQIAAQHRNLTRRPAKPAWGKQASPFPKFRYITLPPLYGSALLVSLRICEVHR